MTWEAFITGSSLAMDAFAVSICAGAELRDDAAKAGWRLALACGAFQFLMPLLGWVLGDWAYAWVSAVDHWVAFILLALVGGDMVYGVLKGGGAAPQNPASSWKVLLALALATSIDALVVGAGFALVRFPVMELAIAAGLVTAPACALGVWLGRIAGARLGRWAELLGGVLLIVMGLHVLVSHLLEG